MFAVALTLCTFASCNTYMIATDTEWHTQAPCMDSLITESTHMATVWRDDAKLSDYLKRFNVTEDVKALHDYDYTCEWLASNDIP